MSTLSFLICNTATLHFRDWFYESEFLEDLLEARTIFTARYCCSKGSEKGDATAFVSVLLFLYNRNENNIEVVLEEFGVTDPFEDLGNQVNHYPHPCRRLALELMRLIGAHTYFFKKVTGHVTRVRSASDIIGPCCVIEYGNDRYVSIL